VATRHDTVRDLLWLADVGTNDVVYDLGSGDRRIVIAAVRDFGVRRAVGIELNAQLVQESREKAAEAGVADRIQFIQGDLTGTWVPATAG
jgi:tRNA1(Val) A37 N6-methylase TrmN6